MTITLDGSNANTVGVINSATAKNATGTAVDFTGIPAGTKRITVMFNGVSTSGASNIQVQLGSGSPTVTGYTSASAISYAGTGVATTATTGMVVYYANAGWAYLGSMAITNVSGNTWVSNHCVGSAAVTVGSVQGGGNVTLSGVLDRFRITTVNGTDTFDAGSINILYE